MEKARVNGMAKQLTTMNSRFSQTRKPTTRFPIELLNRAAHGCSFLWTAAASAARHRFGLLRFAPKAPSPLRSAGALQKVVASRNSWLLLSRGVDFVPRPGF